jgi:hydrogenase maturation factor
VKLGKLTPGELQSIVFPRRGASRPDVLVRAGVGLDCAVLDLGGDNVVLSSDPITGAGAGAGWLAIHVGCNDVATAGAQPVGVLLTLLLSPTSPLDDARSLMSDAERAAAELGIEIVGGHSEITASVRTSLIVATAIGRVVQHRFVTPAGARPGDTLLLTKAAGLEGTAILAADRADYLNDRVDPDTIERARAFGREISIVSEALTAAGAGVTAMHDVTEGGVLGALTELSVAAHVGVDVDLDRVPVRPETRAICQAFDVDPLALVSSGALLIATSRPKNVSTAIHETGHDVTQIGRVVDGPNRIIRSGVSGPLVPPERDALWDALATGPRG